MHIRSIVPVACSLLVGVAMAQHEAPPKQPPAPAEKAPAPKTDDSPSKPIPSTMVTDPNISSMELLRRDASRLMETIKSPSVRQYLFNTNYAPMVEQPRVVYYNKTTGEAFSPDDFGNISDVRRKEFTPLTLDEKFYYHTRYGSPHAYARALDLLCLAASPDGNCFGPDKRLLDFGNGGIVHLRLLAVMGMRAVGVDVDPLLRAFFREPEDSGKIVGSEENVLGFLQLEYGHWPADEALKQSIGGGFDFIISKNTLKKGYIHPEKPVDPKTQVVLGVSDEVFVGELFRTLKPGGLVMIYNICPAQSKETYIPWADGKNPFPRELWEKAGFQILNFDTEDREGVKVMAHALGWDKGESPMDLENDLFAWYTIARRPMPDEVPSPKPDAKPDAKPVVVPVPPPSKK